jgi:uncharacterized cupin superfamily protein
LSRTASAGPSTRPGASPERAHRRSTAATRLLCADAAALDLPEDALDPTTVLAGAPQASFLALGERQGSEIGVWELTEGEVADVEADEVFVVLSGRGSVQFEDGSALALGPGTVVRLHAGDRTVWRVTQALRKVYVA